MKCPHCNRATEKDDDCIHMDPGPGGCPCGGASACPSPIGPA